MEKFPRFMLYTHRVHRHLYIYFLSFFLSLGEISLSISASIDLSFDSVVVYNGFVGILYCCVLNQHYHYYDALTMIVIIIEFEVLFCWFGVLQFFTLTILKSLCRFLNMFAAVSFSMLKTTTRCNDGWFSVLWVFRWREFHRCTQHSTYCLWISILFNKWMVFNGPCHHHCLITEYCLTNSNHSFHFLFLFFPNVIEFSAFASLIPQFDWILILFKKIKMIQYLQNAVRPADNGDSGGKRNPLKPDETQDRFWNDDW